MESPRYITRLRMKSVANMDTNLDQNSDTDTHLDEIPESVTSEQSHDLDFEALLESVESKDSKIIVSILANQSEKMKDMVFGIEYLKLKVKAINNRVKENEEKISTLEQENQKKDSEIKQLKTDISDIKKANRKLNAENESIKKSVENQGIHLKRKYVIFTGVKESVNFENSMTIVESLLVDKMQLNSIEVLEAFRRGQKRNTGPPRPLIAKVKSVNQKIAILRNSAKLRGLGIYVSEDLPPHMLQAQRQLLPVLRIAKQSDRSARITRDKLVYKKSSYSVRQVFCLDFVDRVGTRQEQHGTLFHGQFSKLSNFYPAKVMDSGITFNSSEHAYQYRKAIYNKQPDIAEQISKAHEPLEAKRLGSNIETTADWNREQGTASMKEIVKKKFLQNPELGRYLTSLPNLPIIECNRYDSFWGVGCSLPDAERNFPRVTENNNHLGKILYDVKVELQEM